MKVVALPEVRLYLKELIQILYDKDYFSFEDSAIQYVEELLHDIQTSLPIRVKRPAPIYFNRYGNNMYYAIFKKNKQTQWYVFFNIYSEDDETIYLIRFISNNHVISQVL